MKENIRALSLLLAGIILFMQLKPCSFAAQKEETVINIPFSNNFAYINQDLVFKIEGPVGWYGAMQAFDKDNKPLYPSLRNVRALYIKYYGAEEKRHIFNPMFEIKILPKDNHNSSLDALKYYISKIPTEAFLTMPTALGIGDKEWAICEYRISAGDINIVRKVYILLYKDSLILLQASDTAEEYKNDKKLFDEAVRGIKFASNYLDLLSK